MEIGIGFVVVGFVVISFMFLKLKMRQLELGTGETCECCGLPKTKPQEYDYE